jgi:phosphoribosylformylglycinamidine cyclo-ligase
VDTDSWQWPALFRWLQRAGDIDDQEMQRTFNCGVGMVVVVPRDEAQQALDTLRAAGESAWRLGSVVHSRDDGQAAIDGEAT